MKTLLVVVVLLTGCTHVNRAALFASSATILCDGMQTMKMATAGWDGAHEQNPIMGERPSTAIVGAYFFGALAANAAVWALMPEQWRAPVPVAITAIQANQIAHNMREGAGVCGL